MSDFVKNSILHIIIAHLNSKKEKIYKNTQEIQIIMQFLLFKIFMPKMAVDILYIWKFIIL